MRRMRKLLPILLLFPFACVRCGPNFCLDCSDTGIATNLRGVSAGPDSHLAKLVVWASGSNGVILRSDDYAESLEATAREGGETLDYRGIRGVRRYGCVRDVDRRLVTNRAFTKLLMEARPGCCSTPTNARHFFWTTSFASRRRIALR